MAPVTVLPNGLTTPAGGVVARAMPLEAYSYTCSANPPVVAPGTVLSNGLRTQTGEVVLRSTSSVSGEDRGARPMMPARMPECSPERRSRPVTPARMLERSPAVVVSDSSRTVSPPRIISYATPQASERWVSGSPLESYVSPSPVYTTTSATSAQPVESVQLCSPQPPLNYAPRAPAELVAGYVMSPPPISGQEGWVPGTIEAPAAEVATATTIAPFFGEAPTVSMTEPRVVQAAMETAQAGIRDVEQNAEAPDS